jgi:hypothetical protein
MVEFSGGNEDTRIEKETERSLRAGGFPPDSAAKLAREFVARARATVEEAGLAAFGPLGDRMLALERTNQLSPESARVLAGARHEGVTDDDIRAWWNLGPVEREVMVSLNQTVRAAACMSMLEEDEFYRADGDHAAAMGRAIQKYKQFAPWYGDPREPFDAPPEDRHLPDELRSRVALGIIAKRLQPPTDMSYNAFVRSLIRQRKL